MIEITAVCRVKRGIYKSICDDTCLVDTQIINDGSATVFCTPPTRIYLCDGVGGNAGGRDASMFVCSHISDDFLALNEALIHYGRRIGEPNMATTLTGLIFDERGITLVHAGNTRLYSLRGGFLNQITSDQTTYEWLKRIGNTEGAEACNRSEILCAFGGGKLDYLRHLVVQEVFSDRIPKTLILTTDGIHDYLTEDQMEYILCGALMPEEKINLLIKEAEQNGSQDDCSAVILSLNSESE